jgi:hypothetical protein
MLLLFSSRMYGKTQDVSYSRHVRGLDPAVSWQILAGVHSSDLSPVSAISNFPR